MALEKNSTNSNELCHGIVRNIPVEFHSADLRSFFSHFIESGGVDCFHFRHRPEVQISTDATKMDDVTKGKSCCCVVRLSSQRMNEFIKTYHGQNWVDRNKKCFAKKAIISRIKVSDRLTDEHDEQDYQTRKEKMQHLRDKVEFSMADLAKLPELHPPPLMPSGNVGTPTSVFLEFIRCCKLPPKIVSKLGLTFPRNNSCKKYSNMPFDYESLDQQRGQEKGKKLVIGEETGVCDDPVEISPAKHGEECTVDETNSDTGKRMLRDEKEAGMSSKTHSGLQNTYQPQTNKECTLPEISQGGGFCSSKTQTATQTKQKEEDTRDSHDQVAGQSATKRTQPQSSVRLDTEIKKKGDAITCGGSEELPKTRMATRKQKQRKARTRKSEDQEQVDEESEEEEDWERHEALHNDVDNQGRTRERLFEEEIELKWEKGGSGLVFYTDAAFWRQQEEADMDEEMADDWDIDMSVYEEPGGGDKDSRDLLQMRTEEQWRRGHEVDPNKIGGFEKFTKGFGGRLMRQQGWKEGKGLGSSQVGRAEPVSAEGQTPHSKRGLGYFGEKLQRNIQVKRTRADREVKISTIYDDPDERGMNLFQSQGSHILTYRDNVEFVPSSEQRKVE